MEKVFIVILKDPVDEAIVQRVLEVLILCIMIQIVVKMRVIDSIYVDMLVIMGKRFLKGRVMPLYISSINRVKVF